MLAVFTLFAGLVTAFFAALLPINSAPVITVASSSGEVHDNQIVALNIPSVSVRMRTQDVHQMLADVNARRAAAHLPTLVLDQRLCAVARQHALDMFKRRYFGHETPEGVSPFDRMHSAGINFGYAGENLALNADEPSAQDALWHSEEHRDNILEPHYVHIGIAAVDTNDYGEMFVQEFTD